MLKGFTAVIYPKYIIHAAIQVPRCAVCDCTSKMSNRPVEIIREAFIFPDPPRLLQGLIFSDDTLGPVIRYAETADNVFKCGRTGKQVRSPLDGTEISQGVVRKMQTIAVMRLQYDGLLDTLYKKTLEDRIRWAIRHQQMLAGVRGERPFREKLDNVVQLDRAICEAEKVLKPDLKKILRSKIE